MKYLFIACLSFCVYAGGHAQSHPGKVRKIEPCACPVEVDSSFHSLCAYLLVPENRKKDNGKIIRLPFIIVKSNNPSKKKDPYLYTTGGPGGSSLRWVLGAVKSSVIHYRDCIAFEQRGTHFALPNLWSNELSDAIKEAYRNNLNKDSMVLEGTRRYKIALEAKGIDLSGYNTDETVSDIIDLLLTLQIDSVNLAGGSYSGGLMLAVLQKDPSLVRSLVLDSPLPTFIPIDEDEPANFNEALSILFEHAAKDSTDKSIYSGLQLRFKDYFTSIEGKTFYISYLEKGAARPINIGYTRNELFDIIGGLLGNPGRLKDAPGIINNLITGKHEPYVREMFDDIFNHDVGPSGMRISVYCADQTAYHREDVLSELVNAYPYMKGYHINDVYKAMCDCWQVPPIDKKTKQPFYSQKPVLIADGEMDYACRPLYMDLIHHYMPNSQRILSTSRTHMVGGAAMDEYTMQFLDNPFKKLVSTQRDMVIY